MIDVMQRLAELDADNPNVVSEANKSKKIEKTAKENNGAHGEETTSPIHGGQKKEKTMENLNLESLRYLSGLNTTIAECGMGGSSPASINITAGSGQELTGMLKDIMNLAGVSKVEPHHMPLDNPDAGPSTVISAPPMPASRPDTNAEMHKLMAIVSGPDMDQDSMNSGQPDGEGDEEKMGEDNDRMYDSSPDEKVMGDPMAQFGDINSGDHRQRQAGLPIAKPMETTFKQLLADYEQFISEGTHTQHYKPAPEKKPGALSKLATGAKKVVKALTGPGDDELLARLEKSTGGKRPNKYNAESREKCTCSKTDEDQCPIHGKMDEGKPSAGMTKKEKSAVVKKAVAGKDIGKAGKGFGKVEKAAAKGGAKNPKAVAAAAMWKSQAKK